MERDDLQARFLSRFADHDENASRSESIERRLPHGISACIHLRAFTNHEIQREIWTTPLIPHSTSETARGAVKFYGRGTSRVYTVRAFARARESLLIPAVAASFAHRASTILSYRVYSLLAYRRRPGGVARLPKSRFVKFNDAPRAAYRREGNTLLRADLSRFPNDRR